MTRRLFNPTTGPIMLVVGAAVMVAGVVVSEAKYTPLEKRPRKKKSRRRQAPKKASFVTEPCAPYTWNEAQVRRMVADLIGQGERDRALVATETAARLFGTYPSGGMAVTFPPGPGAPPGVECIWVLTVDLVHRIFDDRDLRAYEDDTFEWVLHDAMDDDYPWEEPSLHPENMPAPGMFFDAGSPTRLDGGNLDSDHDLDKVVRRSLATALSMANMDPRLATGTSSTSKRLRRQMRQLILGSQHNDDCYGQIDPSKGAAGHERNEKGRGLNWMPVHADNLGLMSQGLAPERTTTLEGEQLLQARGARSHMLLWIPAVDLAALADQVPSVVPYQWPDGSSTKEPPPVVQSLGIEMNGVVLPEGAGS